VQANPDILAPMLQVSLGLGVYGLWRVFSIGVFLCLGGLCRPTQISWHPCCR
jgi:hypothetical protein